MSARFDVADLAPRVVNDALRWGADEAEVYAVRTTETEAFLERNDVKLSKTHSTAALGIRVFIRKAMGFASVNDLGQQSVQRAVDNALAIAKNSPPDPHNGIVPAMPVPLLQGLYDPEAARFRPEDALARAVELLRTAREADPRITVDSGNFTATIEESGIANSNAVEASEKRCGFTWSVMGMAKANGEVSSFDVQFGGTRRVRDIEVRSTAQEFARNVLASLGARKAERFRGALVLTPEATRELLLEPLLHSLNSNQVQKGASRFAGQAGQPVAAEALTVVDDGTWVEGLAAASYDREGVAHQRLPLIERGTLRSFMYNGYTARKEGRASTGHAAGTARSSPVVGPSNLLVEAGAMPRQTLIREVSRGLLVTRFSGNVSAVSGDFSGVVKGGAYIERGEAQFPVKETLIAGNVYEALKRISGVSQERKNLSQFALPSIRIEDVSVTAG
jgi:PmbA protein